jgi:DNA-binding LytR/AlgR family response regulator
MPAMSGIEVVRQAGPQTRIVFTTAYKEHAVEAFEHDTVDYILKPFSRERLDRAIKRLHRRMRTERFAELAQHCVVGEPGAHGSSTEPSIFIKLDGRLVRVATADIIAVVAQGNYISIMTAEKRYFIRATLQEISREIGSGALFQVHRSLLVSLPHINEIRPTPRGSLVLTMSDGSRWKTNRTCREELLRALKENDTTVLRNKSG